MTDTPTLTVLADALADILQAQDDADNFPRLYVPSDQPVTRIGFALEPAPSLAAWATSQRLDALFLHRPWRLDKDALPDTLGVVAFHHALDATFAVGYNPRLADALGLRDTAPFGEKDGLPLGIIGDVDPQTWTDFTARARHEFGGVERLVSPHHSDIRRVAIMGAMTDPLVRDAYRAGVNAYVTGQLRMPARDAVRETGIGIIAVGHARGEQWSLRTLAHLLRQRFPILQTILY